MHSHNHDLIAALAEGLLAGDLIASAEAELASCEECTAELAAQRIAVEALSSIKPAAMTATESAGVREGVSAALGLAEDAARPQIRRTRRSPWPAIAFAAGLAGVLAVVPMLGLITTGSDDADTAMTVAGVFREDADGDSLADEAAAAFDGDTTVAGQTDQTEMAAVAPAESAAPPTAAESDDSFAATTTMAPLEPGEEQAARNAVAGESAIRDLFASGPSDTATAASEQIDRSGLACNAAAEQQFGNDYLYVDVSASLDDGTSVVLFASTDWSAMVAFDIGDCSPVLTLP
jgi:hypothetical protein